MRKHPCESCGMPIATSAYCEFCVDESGKLQSFETRFERFLALHARQRPGATREELQRSTLAYMAAMPAWKDHPRIKAEFPDA